MIRKLGLFAVLSAFTVLGTARAEDKPEKRGALRDPEAMFKTLDANGDGKIGKDEFKKGFEKLAEKIEKLKDKTDQIAERLFDRLDTDKDGSLSKDEFKKMSELRGKLGKPK